MADKSIFTKLFELAMDCQTKEAKKVFEMINTMPDGAEKQKLMNDLRNSYNTFMNDCNNVLKAEKQYLKIQSQ
jgi:hypothetical protein